MMQSGLLVKNLSAKEPSARGLDTYCKQYYLCLVAIKWTEAEKGIIVTNHSLSVTLNGSFDHMNIDATSVQNLEIIDPLHSELWGSSNKKEKPIPDVEDNEDYRRVDYYLLKVLILPLFLLFPFISLEYKNSVVSDFQVLRHHWRLFQKPDRIIIMILKTLINLLVFPPRIHKMLAR